MKIIILTLLFGFLPILALNVTSESESHDGYWWNRGDEQFKLAYIAGLNDALSTCDVRFDTVSAQFAREHKSSVTADFLSDFVFSYGGFLKENQMVGMTYGEIMKGIDEFYKDYRNNRILVLDIIPIVKLHLKGKNKTEIDSVAQELRKRYLEEK